MLANNIYFSLLKLERSYLRLVVEGHFAASLVSSSSDDSVPGPRMMGTSEHLCCGDVRCFLGVL